MGNHDSSRTRVAPAFNQLIDEDPTGATWLQALIDLGSRRSLAAAPAAVGTLIANHPRYWGDHERRLPAPASLLKWLVRNVSAESVQRSRNAGETRARRTALAARNRATVQEALAALKAGKQGRRWFVLEGESCPDAFLETERIVLVIEGKRTERYATSRTTWMPKRNQLLRHMDAATDVADGKQVLGLMIIEGDDAGLVPDAWATKFAASLEPEPVAASLPHRSAAERKKLLAGVLGITTWNALAKTIHIRYPLD